MKLYQFNKLKDFLLNRGYAIVEPNDRQQVEELQLDLGVRVGDIQILPEGIFCTVNGQFIQGGVYNKHYEIDKYGQPRFHIFECETITKFKQRGQFGKFYYWSASAVNTTVQRDSNIQFPDQHLQLCSQCQSAINASDLVDRSDFENILSAATKPTTENVVVDLNGYVLDWPRISKAYRQKMSFTCEDCGHSGEYRSGMERRHWHTHHINGNKQDNHPDNLRCLCVLCHAFVNAHHTKEFFRGNRYHELEAYTAAYPIKVAGNPHYAAYSQRLSEQS